MQYQPDTPTHSIHAVMFDLDGTLIDTAGEITVSLSKTLAELNLAGLPQQIVETLIGNGVHSMIERALARAGGRATDLALAVTRFESHYAGIVGTQAEMFPGVHSGLKMLHVSGYKLGVVTNKPRRFTQQLLASVEIDCLFSVVIAGDDGLRRKPFGDMLSATCSALDTDAASALMIGDSHNDVLAARAAGCPIWCVPYGYNEGRSADTLQCDRMIATVHDAAQLLSGLPAQFHHRPR